MPKTLGPFTLQDAGPWTRIAIVDERQTEICDGPYEQRTALVLMAAAPELLAASKKGLEIILAHRYTSVGCNTNIDDIDIASIRAAVEKAGG